MLHLDLAGSATDDIGVSAVRVTVEENDSGRYLQPNGTLSGDSRPAPGRRSATPGGDEHDLDAVGQPADAGRLRGDGDRVRHLGPAGPVDSSGADRATRSIPATCRRRSPRPCSHPPKGTVFTDGRIFVSGRLEDDQQIAQAQVAIRNGAGQYMSSSGTFTSTSVSYRTAFLNSPGSPGSNFSYTTPTIPTGSYTVLVRGDGPARLRHAGAEPAQSSR